MEKYNSKIIKPHKLILNKMRQSILINAMDDSQFARIVNTCQVVQLHDSDTLFEQGSHLTYIYLVISGGIKLQRLAPSGDEKVLDIVQPGKTFAEAALFVGDSLYPVTAVAVMPTVVVGFEAETYLQLLNESNELCINLLGNFSKRLKWMVNEVERLTLHNATFRLVEYLLSQISEKNLDQTVFSLTVPKRVIASRLSIKPETLSRTLKELSNSGLLRLDGTQIELLDIERLRQFVAL